MTLPAGPIGGAAKTYASAASPTTRGGAASAIGDLLPGVLREMKPLRRRGSGLAEVWDRAVGSKLSEETRVASLRQGVLTVEVRSASLLAELDGFRRDDLLRLVLTADPSGRITGLRLRLGSF